MVRRGQDSDSRLGLDSRRPPATETTPRSAGSAGPKTRLRSAPAWACQASDRPCSGHPDHTMAPSLTAPPSPPPHWRPAPPPPPGALPLPRRRVAPRAAQVFSNLHFRRGRRHGERAARGGRRPCRRLSGARRRFSGEDRRRAAISLIANWRRGRPSPRGDISHDRPRRAFSRL